MSLNSKNILIAGGSGALGSALIQSFSELNWNVAATFHDRPKHGTTTHCEWVHMDLRQSNSIYTAVEQSAKLLGSLHAVIHAGGVTRDQPLIKMNLNEWNEALDVNLKSAFLLAKASYSHLIQSPLSHLILVGSMAGKAGHPGQSNYVAAKAGLMALGQSLASEWGGRGVCVNTIWPGVMPSKMTESLSEARLEELKKSNVLGRLSDPSETAKFIAFLIANMSQVSGQCFNLDSRIHSWT